MLIIHHIDPFLFLLFGITDTDKASLVSAIQDFYTVHPFKPVITSHGDTITVDINIPAITSQLPDFNKVVALAEKGRYKEAKPLLLELIKKNPTVSEYHRVMGQIASDEGDIDQAVDYLIDALRWDPTNHSAMVMMGNILAKQENNSTALLYFQTALDKLKADDFLTLNNMAVIKIREHKMDEAKVLFQKAFDINPLYPNTLYGLAMIADFEDDKLQAFNYAISSIKNSKPKDTIHQPAIRLAFSAAKEYVELGLADGVPSIYKAKLELEGGIPIIITPDNSIATAAKMEFAWIYNRDEHIIKHKERYPAVQHLITHEMVHLDFVLQARRENQNKLFTATQAERQIYLLLLKDNSLKLRKLGLSDESITNYQMSMFDGLNRQMYNTPIDLFIEDKLFEEFPELRPYQFLSLYNLLQEGITAMTDKNVLKLSPANILTASRMLNLVNALHFKDVFGVDIIKDFGATVPEMKLAQKMFAEFLDYRDDRTPGEEYEIIQHWGEDLKIDRFFRLVDENEYRNRTDLGKVLNDIENDPFDLDKEDPSDAVTDLNFKDSPAGSMAVVFYMVDALQYFSGCTPEQVKKIAFEIAMLGRTGLDPNDKDKKWNLGTVGGKTFTSLQLLAWMYAAFQLVDPTVDTGLEFGEEYVMAKGMVK